MFKKNSILSFALLLLLQSLSFAQTHEIAITIDDLPFVGESKNFHMNMILKTLQANEVPATGFIIAGSIQSDNWPMLHKFKEAGFGLGNHTLTHLNINQVDGDTYLRELEEADKILTPVMTEPKYFRYPYLAMGTGVKKERILQFLRGKNYRIAPITIDSKDFLFNKELFTVPQEERRALLEELKLRYLDFIWEQTLKAQERAGKSERPQILLIHANLLNAYVLGDIIELYRQHGFSFVSLEAALDSNHKPTPKVSETISEEEKPAIDANIKDFMAWD